MHEKRNIFFVILNNNLKIYIYGVGRVAHILHNSTQSSANILLVGVESIVTKFSNFFILIQLFQLIE